MGVRTAIECNQARRGVGGRTEFKTAPGTTEDGHRVRALYTIKQRALGKDMLMGTTGFCHFFTKKKEIQ